MRQILGIDEAGRGPVIGPLVLAGVLCAESEIERLSLMEVKDSKQLSRPRRAALAREIKALARECQVIAIPPLQLEENLTQIELAGMAQLIQKLSPMVVYLDAPVPPRGISHFVKRLRHQTQGHHLEMIAENKADIKYPIVAAASIIAKVHRDHAIEQLREKYGDFGWGYPSERKTREFLQNWHAVHGTFPDCVRPRWKTILRIMYE